jgi:hypothetical protein
VDFKFVDHNGGLVATANSASEAKAKLQGGHGLSDRQILLDDTGIEISEAELDVLCAAELALVKPRV